MSKHMNRRIFLRGLGGACVAAPLSSGRAAELAGMARVEFLLGTLKILLEAKSRGITQNVGPWVDKLADAGMWLSGEIRQRILSLAGERGELPP